MLGANWVLHCLLVPGAKCAVLQRCSAQLLITGDSLQYADQMEIWDICGAVDSVATPPDMMDLM